MAGGQYRDTHHTVSAGILEALGKGLLIATAGLFAGVLFGTANPAALSIWTVAVAAGAGVGCVVGSALLRNAGFDRCDQEGERSMPAASVGTNISPTPDIAAGDTIPENGWVRRMAGTDRQRENAARSGRGA